MDQPYFVDWRFEEKINLKNSFNFHCLTAIVCMSIIADQVDLLFLQITDGYFQLDDAPCYKAKVTTNWAHQRGSEYSHLNNLISHQIRIHNTFGMFYKGRSAMWMCSCQICRTDVMQSRHTWKFRVFWEDKKCSKTV